MKKLVRKAVGVLLLAIAVAVTQIPTTGVVADSAASSDFQLKNGTLVKYVGTAGTVTVPASVSQIGREAFAGSTTLKSVSFKGEITSVAYRAFAGCSELTEFSIPDSVTQLGNGAFSGCSSLKTVTIGKNLKTLGLGVFAGCDSLKEIRVDRDNPYFTVEDGCLYDKEKTTLYLVIPVREKDTYSMPSTVEHIAEYAFWGCTGIKNISLSNSLEEITAYAFSNCKSLQALSVPYSVKSIDLAAFSDCVRLENVYIPSTVSYIHATAFDGCPRLKIVADVGTCGFQYYEEWKLTHADQSEYEDTGSSGDQPGGTSPGGTTSPDGSTTPGGTSPGGTTNPDGTGSGNTTPGAQDVLGQTHVVGNSAVVFIDNSRPNVYGTQTDGQEQTSGNTGAEPPAGSEDGGAGGNGLTGGIADVSQGILDILETKAVSVPKFTVAGGAIIADQAFYKKQELTEYAIPAGVTQIGEFSFARSGLKRIVIPAGVASVGYGAFYHCDSLELVTVPSTVTRIAPRAFDKSLWLQNWLQGGGGDEGDYLIVGDGILLAYRGAGETAQLPEHVKQIAAGAFSGHTELRGVVLPDSLTEIGEEAFAGCDSLQTVQGGKYVTKIADRAFAGCPVETVHIGENVRQMGLGAVDYDGTAKEASAKVVVFDGRDTLPIVSYEETASRLSNEAARKLVLNDVLFAVVDRNMRPEDLEGTVLDPDYYGFKGLVVCIDAGADPTVTVMACNRTKEELAETDVPESIAIDGKSYRVEGLERLQQYAQEPEAGQEAGSSGGVSVDNRSKVFATDSRISAFLDAEAGSFLLQVKDGAEAKEALDRAYKAVYGQTLPAGAVSFSLELTDMQSGVSITKLGNNFLTVTLPLPADGSGSGIRVVAVDRNGQLENVRYSLEQEGMLTFRVSRLSPFAVYSVGEAGDKMDASPDTGEAVHPKWFVAAGTGSLALAVLFYRPRRKRITF